MSLKKSHGCAMFRSKRSPRQRPPISFACSRSIRMRSDFARSFVVAIFVALVALPSFAQQIYEDLIVAVANDRADEVKRLLARGMDPNSVDPNGDPLLVIASRAGYRAT